MKYLFAIFITAFLFLGTSQADTLNFEKQITIEKSTASMTLADFQAEKLVKSDVSYIYSVELGKFVMVADLADLYSHTAKGKTLNRYERRALKHAKFHLLEHNLKSMLG